MGVMLEEGQYKGRIKKWETFDSSGGTPGFQIIVRLTHKVEEDEENGAERDVALENPVTRTVPFWLSEKALENSLANLRSLGYTRKDLSGLDADDENPHDFGDLEVTLRGKHEEYQGRVTEKYQLVRKSRKLSVKDLLAAHPGLAESFAKEQERVSKADQSSDWKPDSEPDKGEEPPPLKSKGGRKK